MKISTKLILLIGFLIVIGVVMTGIVYYFIAKQGIEGRIEAQLESISVLKENQLNGFIEEVIADTEGIAREKFFRDSFIEMQKAHATYEADEMIYHENVKELLKDKLILDKDFIEFFILNLEGKIHLSTDEKQEGKIKANENYFIEGKEETFVQSFYYDTSLMQPAMTISTPIKDSEGNVVGVLAGRINLEEISEIIVERSGLGETGETYIVNKFNLLVSKSRFIEGIEFKKTIHTKGVKNCLKGYNDFGHYNNYRDIPIFGFYMWMPEREVCLLTEIDEIEAFAPINRLIYILILVGTGLALLTAFIGILLSKRISNPIRQLHEATEQIEKGNFKVKVNIKTGDELEQLGNTFNRTIEALGRLEEERKELDKAKTEFLSITSHELRSPMTPMKAQLQMLIGGYFGKLNKKQKEAIDVVLRNTDRLDKIIVDFLEISRIEAARLKFGFVKVNLTPYIKQLIEEMKGFMPEKKIKIISKIGKLPVMEVDPDRTMQVLRNSINNAIKFSPENSKVEVAVMARKDDVLFSVKDYGQGMSLEDQARIFEPFFQIEQTIYREKGGTGLGLAICKGIVESQRGKIWVKSKLGEGSIFYFTVPLKPVKVVKPIRLLFAPREIVEKKIKEIFEETLGPIGASEFEDLRSERLLEKDKLFKYADSLVEQGILRKEKRREFKNKIASVFGEELPKFKEVEIKKIEKEVGEFFK